MDNADTACDVSQVKSGKAPKRAVKLPAPLVLLTIKRGGLQGVAFLRHHREFPFLVLRAVYALLMGVDLRQQQVVNNALALQVAGLHDGLAQVRGSIGAPLQGRDRGNCTAPWRNLEASTPPAGKTRCRHPLQVEINHGQP
jgi:hypothetical protein